MTLKEMLIHHEGMNLRLYVCPANKLTIGVGRNLEDNGITDEEALFLLDNDIARCRVEAAHAFHWFPRLDSTRQDVIISMIFNMGITRLKTFTKMIAALEQHDYARAASEMLSSRWASQVGVRAQALAKMMLSGSYPRSF